MSRRPIGDYALLSDCHSAALVALDGSIDWLCLPRFDAASVFGRVLDDAAGHWLVRPSGEFRAKRCYVGRTLSVQTTFDSPTGTVLLADALTVPHGEHGHDLGQGAPHTLIRRLEGLDGEVEVEVEFAPRPEYGLVEPLMVPRTGGVITRGGPDRVALSVDVPLDVDGGTARARINVHAGETAYLALTYAPSTDDEPRLLTQAEMSDLLLATNVAWERWSDLHQRYEGPWADLVHASGRILYGLTFRPTGAIVAAPTTSLPEEVGGERNWDYRYTWVRDASFTLDALWVAACPDESNWFFQWMIDAAAAAVGKGAPLQIMFGVGGEHDLSERTLPHLTGWRSSTPVRVGNGAWNQRQLDVYGELLAAAHRLREHVTFDETTRQFLVDVADAAAARWMEPGQGIWEVRGDPRLFTYSRVMCWVALDRAIGMADDLDAAAKVAEWVETRDAIREAVLTHGWSASRGAFSQSFDNDDLDASVLMMPIVGFIEADDERMLSTLDVIERDLTDSRGLVYRYLGTDDGLQGEEGTFVLCTFWLAQAWALAGQAARAREVVERVLPYLNDVGLLAEEVDPDSGELLGNFPQAFSHIGLVNAAWAVSEAESGVRAQNPIAADAR